MTTNPPARTPRGLTTVLLVITALLVLITAIILFLKFQSTPNNPGSPPIPSVSPAPDPTAGWQTYTNEKYQYSIKWPPDWKIVEHSSNFDSLTEYKAPDDSTVRILIESTNSDSLKNYLKDKDQASLSGWEGQPSRKVISSRPLTVDGYAATERVEDWLPAGFTTIVTYLKISNQIFQISITPASDNYKDSAAYKHYSPILSSFKTTSDRSGQFCGGIAGVSCPDGYRCRLDGNYPDAGGKCVKTSK